MDISHKSGKIHEILPMIRSEVKKTWVKNPPNITEHWENITIEATYASIGLCVTDSGMDYSINVGVHGVSICEKCIIMGSADKTLVVDRIIKELLQANE